MSLKYIEVDIADDKSIKLFNTFYNTVLKESFDENQIEKYSQFIQTLSKKKTDFFGNNEYHILMILNNDDIVVGGVIYDYFFDTNTGLIEYIVSSKNVKRQGIASFALSKTCELLNKSAIKNGFPRINFITCEVEKVIFEKQEKHYFWEKYRI